MNILSKEEYNKFRIRYYLGNVNKNIMVKRNDSDIVLFDDTDLLNNPCEKGDKYYDKTVRLTHLFNESYVYHLNCYYKDLYNYLRNYKNNTNQQDIECLFCFGDSVTFKKLPMFIKAKTAKNSDYSVLLKLNTERHCNMLKNIVRFDIPFNDKKNTVLWRGVSFTGIKDFRKNIILNYQNFDKNIIDIKATYDLNKDNKQLIHAKHMNYEEHMKYEEMLKYKFLLSVEGNDVATNLKWCLYSNSVVLMSKPTKCSWFMEDTLIPFEHYVPLNDDCSNIEEMYNWCMNNLEKCENISKNATKYIEPFLDEENEKYITNEVIRNYFNYVKFEE